MLNWITLFAERWLKKSKQKNKVFEKKNCETFAGENWVTRGSCLTPGPYGIADRAPITLTFIPESIDSWIK